MPTLFRTPPEILNFISFECREAFERDYLDVIGRLEAGWQIDMWSLGVLVLEILNGGSLTGEGSDRAQMICLQKELPIRYSYLLSNMEGRLRSLVLQMLSADPQKRPHPR
jgi:serine/threonine protein kinase